MSQQPTDEQLLAHLSGQSETLGFDPNVPELSARLENWQSLIENLEAAGAAEQAANTHTLSEFALERIKSACSPKLSRESTHWKGRVISFLAGAAAVFVAGSALLMDRHDDSAYVMMDAAQIGELEAFGDSEEIVGSAPDVEYNQQMQAFYENQRMEQMRWGDPRLEKVPERSQERMLDSLSALPKVTQESSQAPDSLDTSLILTRPIMDLSTLGYSMDTWLELSVEEFSQVKKTMVAIKAAIDDSEALVASYNQVMTHGLGSRKVLAFKERISTANETIVAVLYRFTATPEYGAGNAKALLEHQQAAEKALELWRKDFEALTETLNSSLQP